MAKVIKEVRLVCGKFISLIPSSDINNATVFLIALIISNFKSICYFLDQQAQYFIDTADYLVTLAREELVHARLVIFVASLTVGTGFAL